MDLPGLIFARLIRGDCWVLALDQRPGQTYQRRRFYKRNRKKHPMPMAKVGMTPASNRINSGGPFRSSNSLSANSFTSYKCMSSLVAGRLAASPGTKYCTQRRSLPLQVRDGYSRCSPPTSADPRRRVFDSLFASPYLRPFHCVRSFLLLPFELDRVSLHLISSTVDYIHFCEIGNLHPHRSLFVTTGPLGTTLSRLAEL